MTLSDPEPARTHSPKALEGAVVEPEPRALTHLDAEGRARMVDVSEKETTRREAVAGAVLHMSPETLTRLITGDVPKGDALAVARIAGIQAAKQTAQLIPLCHPLLTEHVQVALDIDERNACVQIRAAVVLRGPTGPEMEALVAASIAGLALYDMCKAIDATMYLDNVRLLRKSGGRSGVVVREGGTGIAI
ncbi:MAG: cyclic pyranopterin monophosphate synthase MoaC [Candidatus Schekmanbacteria bacterium]|nr:cyclic pyranopterin monophosphate synthase MoaC [Candidatus Schekmanbacteria bacterium]